MHFFTEINGDIWECNSIRDFLDTYFSILLGRITAWIIYLGIMGFAFAWLWS
jgi:hypothetical protein